MSEIKSILDDLAAGKIDAETANRKIADLKKTEKPTGMLEKVSITAVGRRVRVVGDSSVTTLNVEGPHVLRRNGTTMEINSTGDLGPSFQGFSLIRPPRSFDDLRDIGLGKELLIKVNPRLLVNAELTTGGLKTEGVPRLGRIRVTAGGCSVEGVNEVADLLAQAGGVLVEGPINAGRSKIKVESGSLNVRLLTGSNVTIRGEATLGRISWPGDGEHVDEVVIGNGSARLDVAVVMGMATIHTEV